MRRLLVLAAAGLLPLAATGCVAPINVSSHVQPESDFSRYRTFAWADADALPRSDPWLDRNPTFADHMYGAVERQLAGRGIELVDATGQADLLVHYHATVTERLEIARATVGNSNCRTETCPDTVAEFEQCTVVLDVVDARTRQLVWRGWSEHRLDDLFASDETLARDVGRGVALMLARFPRAVVPNAQRRLPGEER
jgi:hypothetical protein